MLKRNNLINKIKLKKEDRILVFAPHVDDETIGTCSLLQASRAQGVEVTIVYVTDSSSSKNKDLACKLEVIRASEAKEIKRKFAINEDHFWSIKDGELESYTNILKNKLKELFTDKVPDKVFLPSLFDKHPDHRVLSKEILNILKGSSVECYLYGGEQPLPLNMINSYLTMDKILKEDAVKVFKSQGIKFDNLIRFESLRTKLLLSGVCFAEFFSKVNNEDVNTLVSKSDNLTAKLKNAGSICSTKMMSINYLGCEIRYRK